MNNLALKKFIFFTISSIFLLSLVSGFVSAEGWSPVCNGYVSYTVGTTPTTLTVISNAYMTASSIRIKSEKGGSYLNSVELIFANGKSRTYTPAEMDPYTSCGNAWDISGKVIKFIIPTFGECDVGWPGDYQNIKDVQFTLSKNPSYNNVLYYCLKFWCYGPEGGCDVCPCTSGTCCDLSKISCGYNTTGLCSSSPSCPPSEYYIENDKCIEKRYNPPCLGYCNGLRSDCPPCSCGINTFIAYSCEGDCKYFEGCSGATRGTCKNYPLGKSCADNKGICNGQGACLQYSINTVFWADAMGKQINRTDVNDTVLLIAESDIETNGKMVNFSITEDLTSNCLPPTYLNATVQNGKAIVSWKVPYCEHTILLPPFGKNDGYTFNASLVEFPSIKNVSAKMDVNKKDNNSRLVVNIITPEDGKIYSISNPINFTQSSGDIDDIFNWTWDFGDGQTNSTEYNTTHPYLTGGPETITLTVESGTDTRYKKTSQSIKILINSTANDAPLAIISGPQEGIPLYALMEIFFNASLSRDTESPLEDLNFTWDFGDGNISTYHGISTVWHKFPNVAALTVFTVNLTVTDNLGLDDNATVKVSIIPSVYYCTGTEIPLGNCERKYDNKGLYEAWCNPISRTLIANCTNCSCSSFNQFYCSQTSDKCIEYTNCNYNQEKCQSTESCYWNGTKCFKCNDLYSGLSGNLGCSAYVNESDCNNDVCNLKINLFDSTEKCSWNKINGKCISMKKSTVKDCDDVYCTQSVNCDNGFYNVTCKTNDPNFLPKKCCDTCQLTAISLDGIACGGTAGISAVMPLFGWMQFIIAISIICGYYFVKSLHATNIRKRK